MSIHGPLPPSNVPPTYSEGSFSHIPEYIQAILCSELAGAAPTAAPNAVGDHIMNAAEQNTYWFFRMYSDCSMIFLNNGFASTSYQIDLQFIYNQASTSGTGFDPALLADLQSFIANPGQLTSFKTMQAFATKYNGIIQGEPPQPYNPSTAYSFTQNLSPDDMYNFYIIQMASAALNPQNNFWNASNGTTPSLLASQFGQFICSYFVQRDGMGTPALQNDLKDFQIMLNNIVKTQDFDKSDYPGLYAALHGGTDASGQSFAGLQKNLNDLMNGQWDFGNSALPMGDNNTPPPTWDIEEYEDSHNGNSPPYDMSYTYDYNFLGPNDMYLAQFIQNWQANI